MENTTLYAKTLFMLTSTEFPTLQVIDVMDVDVAWNTSMVNYAEMYANQNGFKAHDITESNYGRTVTFKAVHIKDGWSAQWTIYKSQVAHFTGQVELYNGKSEVCA